VDVPWYEADDYVEQVTQPFYPAIAIAAQVEGPVTVYAMVSSDGKVGPVIWSGGTLLLGQAAIDAVRQWRLRPAIMDGQPTATRMELVLYFYINGSPVTRARVMELHDRVRGCRALVDAKRLEDAEPACLALADLADKLPGDRRAERAIAHRLAGEVLAARNRSAEALEQFKAVMRFAEPMPLNQDPALACQAAARIYLAAGDFKNAKRAFESAENSLAILRKWLPDPLAGARAEQQLKRELDGRYTRSLQGVLTELVDCLRRAGMEKDARDAQRRLDRLSAGAVSK
jgi:TonB family protein